MPSKGVCNKIKDPAKRKRCLEYAGEYAKKTKTKGSPTDEMSRVRKGGY